MHREKFVNAIVEELIQNDCDIEATGDFLIDCLNEAVEVYTAKSQKGKDAEVVIKHIVKFLNEYYPEVEAGISVNDFIESFDNMVAGKPATEVPREEKKEVRMTLDEFLREMGW